MTMYSCHKALSAGRLSDASLYEVFRAVKHFGHKALSAGRLSDSPLGIARPYRPKIAISTKLNFFPKKYSRKVTKIILNPRRFVLSAICLFQMYLIPDCYRTFNDFQMFSNNFFWTSIRFSFSMSPIIPIKIFLSSIFHEISKNFFKFLVEISFIVLYNTNFY